VAIREKIGIAVILAVALGLVGYTLLGPGGGKRVQLRQELATMQGQNLKLIETNKRLALEIEALKTRRDYQEKVVREELGLVRPDEIFVHLPNENPKRHKAETP
jgi:cell division protein FtsB